MPRRGASRGGCATDGGRRAAGRVSVWWSRFVHDCGAHAGAEQSAGEDLHNWVSRTGIRRGHLCKSGGQPPGDRAHGTLRDAEGCHGRHSTFADDLRRTVFRLITDSDVSSLPTGTAAGDGQIVGRWWGRIIWRVSALSPGPADLEPRRMDAA